MGFNISTSYKRPVTKMIGLLVNEKNNFKKFYLIYFGKVSEGNEGTF